MGAAEPAIGGRLKEGLRLFPAVPEPCSAGGGRTSGGAEPGNGFPSSHRRIDDVECSRWLESEAPVVGGIPEKDCHRPARFICDLKESTIKLVPIPRPL